MWCGFSGELPEVDNRKIPRAVKGPEKSRMQLEAPVTMMSIDEFGGNPLRSLPPTSSIRQKKIEQNGKKQHKKTAIALVDLAT